MNMSITTMRAFLHSRLVGATLVTATLVAGCATAAQDDAVLVSAQAAGPVPANEAEQPEDPADAIWTLENVTVTAGLGRGAAIYYFSNDRSGGVGNYSGYTGGNDAPPSGGSGADDTTSPPPQATGPVCTALATAVAFAAGTTVLAATATGGCAVGMLVATAGTGELVCIVPAAGALVAAAVTALGGAVMWALCNEMGPVEITLPLGTTIPQGIVIPTRPESGSRGGKCRCSLSESKASEGNKPTYCPDRVFPPGEFTSQSACVAAGNLAAQLLGCGFWVKHCNISY